MNQIYGSKLNPHRQLKKPLALKGVRQSVILTHNPSSINAGDTLKVLFPKLGQDDVIVPGTTKLAFNIDLKSNDDDNRTLYPNVGHNLIKQMKVSLGGSEITNLSHANVYRVFKDTWRPKEEENHYRGIEPESVTKLRIGAGDADPSHNSGKDKAIADAFKNRYCIPLEFEMMTESHPFLPSGLSNQLTYELHFNDSKSVVKSTDDEATYSMHGISLEFEMVTNKHVADSIRRKLQGKTHFLFERVLNYQSVDLNKSDTTWNININQSVKSLKGVLLLFKEAGANPGVFYNPKITNTTVTIEGKPNQLYSQGLKPYQHWEEIKKFFGDSGSEFGVNVTKDLSLFCLKMGEYLKNNYGLWLDMRTTDDNKSHGSGRQIGEVGGGVSIHLEKDSETAGVVTCHVFLVMDAQLSIEGGRFSKAYY